MERFARLEGVARNRPAVRRAGKNIDECGGRYRNRLAPGERERKIDELDVARSGVARGEEQSLGTSRKLPAEGGLAWVCARLEDGHAELQENANATGLHRGIGKFADEKTKGPLIHDSGVVLHGQAP